MSRRSDNPEPGNKRVAGKQLMGMPVFSIADGKRQGQVSDIVFDPQARRLTGFYIRCPEGLLRGGESWFVSESAIHSIGEDIITVSAGNAQQYPAEETVADTDETHTLLGKRLTTESGAFLGSIDDIILERNSRRIVAYSVSGGLWQDMTRGQAEIGAEHFLSIGRDVVVVPDSVRQTLAQRGQVDDTDRVREPEEPAPVPESLAPASTGGDIRAGSPGDPNVTAPNLPPS